MSGNDYSPLRRRLLIVLGFGGVNVAVVKSLGQPVGSTEATSQVPSDSSVGTNGETGAQFSVPDNAQLEIDPDHVYDLVITNGRVLNPESGFDEIANVGIDGGFITAVATSKMMAKKRINATGKVVAPGFIDILSGEPNGFGEWFKIADGVTTNLTMHGVNNYATAYFENLTGKVPVHFGGAYHQHFLRGEDPTILARPDDPLNQEQIDASVELAIKNLENGFSGICFSPEYSPGTSTEEILALTEVAKEAGHDVFFHVRYSDPDPPGTSVEAITEVLDLARATGVGVHIEHITSTGGTFVLAETLELLRDARAEGLDVTACVYPYDYWATTLNSFRFHGDWQDRYRISYSNLQIAGTDTVLSEDTYIAAKEKNLLVAAVGSIPEDEVLMALNEPWIMIGSDAILSETLNNHPRSVGTFSRVLGRYVRELGVLSMSDALAKMTILPALRMHSMIPEMRLKGRLRAGAHADIVVFDPATVGDRATISNPAQESVGFSEVIVMGVPVMEAGKIDRSVLPGQSLRSTSAL